MALHSTAHTRLLTAVGATVACFGIAVALSGCGILEIERAEGQGECFGKPAVVTTSQSVDGETVSLDYVGPTGVSLMAVQGLYIDRTAEVGGTDRLINVGFGINGVGDYTSDVKLGRFQFGPEWAISTAGGTLHAHFEGSIIDLLSDLDVPLRFIGPDYDQSAIDLINSATPIYFPIYCGDLAGGPQDTDDQTLLVSSLQFTAAQALFPNEVSIDPVTIESQTVSAGSVTGTMSLPASATVPFGDFVPDQMVEMLLSGDDPSVSNESFGDLWWQLYGRPSPLRPPFVTVTNSPIDDGSFAFSLDTDGDPDDPKDDAQEGDYVAALIVSNADFDVTDTQLVGPPNSIKIVFSSFHYDEETGITINDPAVLAATGTADGSLVAAGGLAAIVVGVGVSLIGRRFSLSATCTR